MKKLIQALLVVLLLPAASWGQDGSVRFDWKNQYLIGKGFVVCKRPVAQTGIKVPLGDTGFTFDLWGSKGFDRKPKNGPCNEVDYDLGWSKVMEGFNVSIGFAFFDIYEVGRIAGDVAQPYFEVARSFEINKQHALTPYFRSEILVPIEWRGVDAKSGAQIYLGLRHRWGLIPDIMDVNHSFTFIGDTGAFVKSDHGVLGDYKIALTWKLPAGITAGVPTFREVFPISSFDDGKKHFHKDDREAHGVVGVNLTVPFSAVRSLFK